MSNLRIGYLFRKKHINYQSKIWEIFEFVDYVAAISFTNSNDNKRCNIISGNNVGIYANSIDTNSNEEDFVFFPDNLNKAIEDNEKSVDFVEIRKKRISRTAKYYLINDNRNGLIQLENNDLIDFLEKDSIKRKINTKSFKKIILTCKNV